MGGEGGRRMRRGKVKVGFNACIGQPKIALKHLALDIT